jgi:hypothetical protein
MAPSANVSAIATAYGMSRLKKLLTYDDTIHRCGTNGLRNIARLFGHLLANDAISWTVFQVIKMNEDDTTGSFYGPRDQGTLY